jgi:cation diffusion facilitator family transporter
MTSETAAGRIKQRAALVSVVSNTLLTAFKLATALVTHSVSVLSEALHSGLDLAAATMALLAVRKSQQPADADHQFGHGKFESASGLAEGVLILVAVALIVWSATKRLLYGGTELALPAFGAAVMGVSATANFFVSRMLFRVARESDSVALEADAWHLRTDVWTSLGVLGGMVLISVGRRAGVRGAEITDPIVALGVGVVIARAAWSITRQAWDHLIDRSLPSEETGRIDSLLREHYPRLTAYHRLRTRKAGPHRYIDLHLVVPRDQSVAEAHELCDHLEADLRALLPGAEVMIHVEPEGRDD